MGAPVLRRDLPTGGAARSQAEHVVRWPSREEWAKCERTLRHDMDAGARASVSCSLADYASPDEIALAIQDLGRAVRAIPGDRLSGNKGQLSRLGKEMRDGRVIFSHPNFDAAIPASARRIVERYRTACDAAADACQREVESRPVDDAAWELELERRTRIQSWRAGR